MEQSKIRRLNAIANFAIILPNVAGAYALYMTVTERIDSFKGSVYIQIMVLWSLVALALKEIKLLKIKSGEKK